MDRLTSPFARVLSLALVVSLAAPPAEARNFFCADLLKKLFVGSLSKEVQESLSLVESSSKAMGFSWTRELKEATAGVHASIVRGRKTTQTFDHMGYKIGMKAIPLKGQGLGRYRIVVGHSRASGPRDVKDLLMMQNSVAKVLFDSVPEEQLKSIRFEGWVPSRFKADGQAMLTDLFKVEPSVARRACGRGKAWAIYGIGAGTIVLATSIGGAIGDSLDDGDAFIQETEIPGTDEVYQSLVDTVADSEASYEGLKNPSLDVPSNTAEVDQGTNQDSQQSNPDSLQQPTQKDLDWEKEFQNAQIDEGEGPYSTKQEPTDQEPVKDQTQDQDQVQTQQNQAVRVAQNDLPTQSDTQVTEQQQQQTNETVDTQSTEQQTVDNTTSQTQTETQNTNTVQQHSETQTHTLPVTETDYYPTSSDRGHSLGKITGLSLGTLGFIGYCYRKRSRENTFVWELTRATNPPKAKATKGAGRGPGRPRKTTPKVDDARKTESKKTVRKSEEATGTKKSAPTMSAKKEKPKPKAKKPAAKKPAAKKDPPKKKPAKTADKKKTKKT